MSYLYELSDLSEPRDINDIILREVLRLDPLRGSHDYKAKYSSGELKCAEGEYVEDVILKILETHARFMVANEIHRWVETSSILWSWTGEQVTSSGSTPLFTAVRFDLPRVVRWLLRHGALPTSTCNGATPLHYAAAHSGRYLCAAALVEEVDEEDLLKMLDASLEREATARALLPRACDDDVDGTDAEAGATPLECAADVGDYDKLLLLLTARGNLIDPKQRTRKWFLHEHATAAA